MTTPRLVHSVPRRFGAVSACLLVLAVAPPAAAVEDAEDVAEAQASGNELSARFGGVYFGLAQSLALEHIAKTGARLAMTTPLSEDLRLGAAVSSVLTTSSNYAVAGVHALARYRLWGTGGFDLGVLAGLGVGYNAPILHTDLEAGFPVIPYGYLGVEGRFRVARGWHLGFELADEQLSVLHLGATLTAAY